MTDNLRAIATSAMYRNGIDPAARGVIAALLLLNETVAAVDAEVAEDEALEDRALEVLKEFGADGATDPEFAEALEKKGLDVPRRQRQRWLGGWGISGFSAVRRITPGGLTRTVHAAHAEPADA